jgi:hypothetical protein
MSANGKNLHWRQPAGVRRDRKLTDFAKTGLLRAFHDIHSTTMECYKHDRGSPDRLHTRSRLLASTVRRTNSSTLDYGPGDYRPARTPREYGGDRTLHPGFGNGALRLDRFVDGRVRQLRDYASGSRARREACPARHERAAGHSRAAREPTSSDKHCRESTDCRTGGCNVPATCSPDAS